MVESRSVPRCIFVADQESLYMCMCVRVIFVVRRGVERTRGSFTCTHDTFVFLFNYNRYI
jgi:hypothetical protein